MLLYMREYLQNHGGAYRGALNRNTEMRYRIGVLGEYGAHLCSWYAQIGKNAKTQIEDESDLDKILGILVDGKFIAFCCTY